MNKPRCIKYIHKSCSGRVGPSKQNGGLGLTNFRFPSMFSPEKLSHRDASLMDHGGYKFSQVEPDVRYIYGDVFRSLQGLL